MRENALFEVLKIVSDTARRLGIKVVIMGGMAVSVYAAPRATFDIDAIGDIKEELLDSFLSDLKSQGFSFDEKRPVKIIAGLPFITLYYRRFQVPVDLFLVRNEFQMSIVQRACTLRVSGLDLDLISPEDLILIKFIAGRSRDIEDIRQILIENSQVLDFNYLRQWAAKLGQRIFLEDELKSLGIIPPSK
jgi:predicted nucleotidyltransferase